MILIKKEQRLKDAKVQSYTLGLFFIKAFLKNLLMGSQRQAIKYTFVSSESDI